MELNYGFNRNYAGWDEDSQCTHAYRGSIPSGKEAAAHTSTSFAPVPPPVHRHSIGQLFRLYPSPRSKFPFSHSLHASADLLLDATPAPSQPGVFSRQWGSSSSVPSELQPSPAAVSMSSHSRPLLILPPLTAAAVVDTTREPRGYGVYRLTSAGTSKVFLLFPLYQ